MDQVVGLLIVLAPVLAAGAVLGYLLVGMLIYSDWNRWQPGREFFGEYRRDWLPRDWVTG